MARGRPLPDELAADRERALALTPVSRETLQRLDAFVALLLEWQTTTNLVAPSTLSRLWTRHIADSLQLLTLGYSGSVWTDIGTGGGFPGLILAVALARSGASVHLVESNTRKAAFLREAVRVTGASATVHAMRAEAFAAKAPAGIDVVTARAVAPLATLFGYVAPLLRPGTVALLPKGQDVEAELTEATKYWKVRADLVPSMTDVRGRIVVIHSLGRKD